MESRISTTVGTNGLHARIYSRIISMTTLLFLLGLPLAAYAKNDGVVCGPEVKEDVAKVLGAIPNEFEAKKLAMETELYEKYQYCKQDVQLATEQYDNFFAAAGQCGAKVPYLGSLAYEEMSCCGYDPQRRQFACPVKIKRNFGFGNAPLAGSREYVLHCVANANDVLVPVGVDSVHLANELYGERPSWQFAVIANANANLDTIYPMNGETRRARSILSWGLQPTSCNYQPIWGNALDYRIRLDQ